MMLGQICAVQRQYGKAMADFGTMMQGFLWVLQGIPMPKIEQALKHYMRRETDIPTPADIFKLIEGEGKPIMDKATYIGLKEDMKANKYITPDERQYIRDYEKHHVGGYTLDN